MAEIKKVLIANRGEIALRVIRSCKEKNISTVAVYSEPDSQSPHVLAADESVLIGKAASSESYLVMEKVIEAAKRTGADAIHPGYGFLSENAAFAEMCGKSGLIFIGPKPYAIEVMGDKTRARELMANAGVPYPPGTESAMTDIDEAMEIADDIGYPILVKAAAGGGGKGMRIVSDKSDFVSSVKSAKSEAKNAFGDDRVYIEKYLEEPRHIEFQILADSHGNVVHLFERECSIQRRHQKVIEEAPSCVLTPQLREEMGKAAVEAARSCKYEGAGTVEFMVDKHLNYYFLEMNTRLQVEHPVTELITGLDLVSLQIDIAEGKELPFSQSDLSINGHAVECRIYAEDPENNFLPSTGLLSRHRIPAGPGIRVDAGVEEGQPVTINYDPMISKLCAHAENREAAIQRMLRALGEYEISGVRTTIPFCTFTLNHPAFREGDFDTHFVPDHFTGLPVSEEREYALAAIIAPLIQSDDAGLHRESSNSRTLPADDRTNWWVKRRV
ncbi:acetyl-CoA carboxylase biotin carboxylase subunit [Rhodohalobacter mucosus]|uniref:Acetyl-CoA carboxylase biotin carboxylase subunit n=1 Tax=Rhodohalobacter mucosus TaxID=2079485 RepID=A0A316U2L6_9BACT|nr:acetyl-CoA carboxylase biotin carboxylase subunit [Rhodohalobacter mucosus]PWN07516.1 acetyl-CoA carboxylase biotin carboxylase subunit [Rhodohalobacter mucosus]